MILSRYLLRDTALAWLAVASMLLLIMVSTRFASVLNFAAKGQIPGDLLVQVALLSSLRYLNILMPVSLLLAVMLALGRLYSDNEIAAMAGCGVSLGGLYRPIVLLALLLAAGTAALSFQIGPWAGRQADSLVKHSRQLLQFAPFDPGKFQPLDGGRAVFYTAGVSSDGAKLGPVFTQMRDRADSESTLIAANGTQSLDAASGDRVVTLHDGYRYSGEPGQAGFDISHFKSLKLRLSPPPFRYVNSQRQLATTASLMSSNDPADRAELQSRIAAPLSVLILALLALPLSYLRPRQGRYSKIVIGVLVYLVYANLIGFGQTWIAKGRIPPELGLWWAHALTLAVALVLIARQQGWRRPRRQRVERR